LPGGSHKEKLTGFMDMVEKTVLERAQKHGRMIPICLHLDHLQKDEQLAYAARDAGFTSVELDFSKQDTSDRKEAVQLNIQKCAPIIDELHTSGISVEVEEGEIGSAAARAAQTPEEILKECTSPENAVDLCQGANPEAMAVFIGSSHGEFIKEPVIYYKRLGEIREAFKNAG